MFCIEPWPCARGESSTGGNLQGGRRMSAPGWLYRIAQAPPAHHTVSFRLGGLGVGGRLVVFKGPSNGFVAAAASKTHVMHGLHLRCSGGRQTGQLVDADATHLAPSAKGRLPPQDARGREMWAGGRRVEKPRCAP